MSAHWITESGNCKSTYLVLLIYFLPTDSMLYSDMADEYCIAIGALIIGALIRSIRTYLYYNCVLFDTRMYLSHHHMTLENHSNFLHYILQTFVLQPASLWADQHLRNLRNGFLNPSSVCIIREHVPHDVWCHIDYARCHALLLGPSLCPTIRPHTRLFPQ